MGQNDTAPESVTLAWKMWMVIVGVEVLHQIMNVVMSVAAKDRTVHMVYEQYVRSSQGESLDMSLITMSVIVAAILVGIIAVGIMAIMVWLAFRLVSPRTRSAVAQRLLIYFGIYLTVRVFLVLSAQPLTHIPMALFAIDGILQILTGIAAAIATYFLTRPDTLEWTGVQSSHKPQKR